MSENKMPFVPNVNMVLVRIDSRATEIESSQSVMAGVVEAVGPFVIGVFSSEYGTSTPQKMPMPFEAGQSVLLKRETYGINTFHWRSVEYAVVHVSNVLGRLDDA